MVTPLDMAGSLPLAVLVTDQLANVLAANRFAEAICEDKSAVTVVRGKLFAGDDTARVHAIIRLAYDGRTGPQVMKISRLDAPPIAILCVPIPWEMSARGQIKAVAVLISDPALHFDSDEAVLRRLYGLTKAEARVASCLINGFASDEIARQLKTSIHTVRSHTKKLFQKTGTCRQSELLRLLLSGPATVVPLLRTSTVPQERLATYSGGA